jgi:hypothetical protein
MTKFWLNLFIVTVLSGQICPCRLVWAESGYKEKAAIEQIEGPSQNQKEYPIFEEGKIKEKLSEENVRPQGEKTNYSKINKAIKKTINAKKTRVRLRPSCKPEKDLFGFEEQSQNISNWRGPSPRATEDLFGFQSESGNKSFGSGGSSRVEKNLSVFKDQSLDESNGIGSELQTEFKRNLFGEELSLEGGEFDELAGDETRRREAEELRQLRETSPLFGKQKSEINPDDAQ